MHPIGNISHRLTLLYLSYLTYLIINYNIVVNIWYFIYIVIQNNAVIKVMKFSNIGLSNLLRIGQKLII